MKQKKQHFVPETVDSQIDQLAQEENRLVNTLHHVYRPQLSSADQESLERIRQRLTTGKAGRSPIEHAPGASYAYTTSRKRYSGMHIQPASPQTTRRVYIYRWLSALAAVLVIGLIIGSLLMVINLTSQPQNAQNHMNVASDNKNKTTAQPSAVQNHVYITDPSNIYMLNEKDGSVIWKRSAGEPIYHTGMFSVKDGTVYTQTMSALFALKASNGSILWHIPMPQDSLLRFIDSSIYILQEDGTLAALNAQNGTQKWHNTTVQKAKDMLIQNGRVYVKVANGSLYVLDAATGQERWHYTEATMPPGLFEQWVLTIDNGVVYDASMNYLYAFNEQDGKLLWQQQVTETPLIYDLRVSNEYIYVHSSDLPSAGNVHSDYLLAFTRDGKHLWTSANGYMFAHIFGINAYRSRDIVLAEGTGTALVYGLNAQNGTVHWKIDNACPNPNAQCVMTAIGIIGNTLYVYDRHDPNTVKLDAFDLNTGKNLSERTLAVSGDWIFRIGAYDGIAYLTSLVSGGTNNVTLYALRLSDGKVLWKNVVEKSGEAKANDSVNNITVAP